MPTSAVAAPETAPTARSRAWLIRIIGAGLTRLRNSASNPAKPSTVAPAGLRCSRSACSQSPVYSPSLNKTVSTDRGSRAGAIFFCRTATSAGDGGDNAEYLRIGLSPALWTRRHFAGTAGAG